VLTACGHEDHPAIINMDFFDPGTPARFIGSDDDTWKTGNYEVLWYYAADRKGNVYIADSRGFKVDKFDSNGCYLLSFGGVKHESLKYPGWQEVFAADGDGNLAAYSNGAKKWLFFSHDGKDFHHRDFDVNHDVYVKKMMFDKKGNLFVLAHTPGTHAYSILKADPDKNFYGALHTDNQRIRPLYQDLPPDFDIDDEGHIYITDTIEYKVYKYGPDGHLIKTFFKDSPKIKMEAHDFYYQSRPGYIQQIEGFENMLKRFNEKSRYFPAVFGINVDGSRVYLWSSEWDEEKKYRVDVVDLDFNAVCTTSYYNAMGKNGAVIRNGYVHIPNIESDNMELKKDVGRFGVFNIPYKLGIYRLSGKIR